LHWLRGWRLVLVAVQSYMHEHGLVAARLAFAKRYYDQAIETTSEAFIPAKLALLKLQHHATLRTVAKMVVRHITGSDFGVTDTAAQAVNPRLHPRRHPPPTDGNTNAAKTSERCVEIPGRRDANAGAPVRARLNGLRLGR